MLPSQFNMISLDLETKVLRIFSSRFYQLVYEISIEISRICIELYCIGALRCLSRQQITRKYPITGTFCKINNGFYEQHCSTMKDIYITNLFLFSLLSPSVFKNWFTPGLMTIWFILFSIITYYRNKSYIKLTCI